MYVFYDSQGIVQSIAVASSPIEGYSSPFAGLTDLYLDDTEYTDVQQEPMMYKIVSNTPVKQAQAATVNVTIQPPTVQDRLLAVEAAIAALMGV